MRRRYVMIEGELVEVSQDYDNRPTPNTDAVLWNDRLYQDGGDPRFSSRAAHRDFMKRNGLTTIDDFNQTFKDGAKRRVEIRNGTNVAYNREVKADLIETVRKLDATRRR